MTHYSSPKTLAVVGVSLTHDRHPANVIYYKNNLRQKVKVFPVNDRGGTLQGESVYTRLSEIPEPIDLAVIATRAEQVPRSWRNAFRPRRKGRWLFPEGSVRVAERTSRIASSPSPERRIFRLSVPTVLAFTLLPTSIPSSSRANGSSGRRRAGWP